MAINIVVSVALSLVMGDVSVMALFENSKQFEQWLEGKSASWAQILACRLALRVLPIAVQNVGIATFTFRPVGICFAAVNRPSIDWTAAVAQVDTYGKSTRARSDYSEYGAVPAGRAARATLASYVARSIDAAVSAAWNAVDQAYAAAFNEFDYAATRGALRAVNSAALAARAARATHAVNDSVADALYTDDGAADAIWSSLVFDAEWLDRSNRPDNAAEAMTAQPLWLEGQPEWFDPAWQTARSNLQAYEATPDPWVDWFERRIAGHATAFALPRAEDQAVQIRIAEQDDVFWERGRAAVNTDIQAWIDAATLPDYDAPPDVPAQRPNELITTARDGRVALVHVPPLPSTPEQDQRRRAAWQAIRDALDDYRADGPSDNHPRLNRMIDRVSAALGSEFDALNPVGLGTQAQYLHQYAARADEFLVADRAADLVGLNVVVGSLLPRFAEWQAYLDDQDTRSDVPSAALDAATAIVAAIAQQEVAEPEVNIVLAEMVADANDEASVPDADDPKLQTYRQRLLGGLGNTLATMARIALDGVKWLVEKGWKLTKSTAGYVIKAGDPGLQEAIKAGTKYTALFVMFSAVDHLSALAGLQPGLAWLGPLLVFLKANVLKD